MVINEKVKELIQAKKGFVVIMAGSTSDEEHIKKITDKLFEYRLPHETRICSAHKQADKLVPIIREYNSLCGSYAIIAVAGGTDALSGTAGFHAEAPVISCPPDAPNQSCLTNPPGSSNAYIKRPGDAVKFIAQIYAGVNPKLREKIATYNANKIAGLEKGDEEFRKQYRSLGE